MTQVSGLMCTTCEFLSTFLAENRRCEGPLSGIHLRGRCVEHARTQSDPEHDVWWRSAHDGAR